MKTFDDRKKSVRRFMADIQRKKRKHAVVVTSVVLLVSILALVLFIPYDTAPPNVRMYEESEYYTLIQKINTLRFEPPKHKNRFEALADAVSNLGPKDSYDGMMQNPVGTMGNDALAPGFSPGTNEPLEYVEVTDNQVQGVIEADIFKRSDQYVYYLRGANMCVYSIAQENSEMVSNYSIQYADDSDEEQWAVTFLNGTQMYLSKDCHTVTVLLQCAVESGSALTMVINLDVSDPSNITEKDRVYFVGSYVSSRMVDGNILLTYNYGFKLEDVMFDDPATFVPQYGKPGNMNSVPGDCVICPEDASDARYTVVCKLESESLEVDGAVALLGYSKELYVSQDTMYATRSYTLYDKEPENNQDRQTAMTEITGIGYAGDRLQILGSIVVEGSLKDQFSMDQFEGVLRVVASTRVSYFHVFHGGLTTSVGMRATEQNVNLYCIDLNNWQIASQVIAFAPEGEDAQAVRFEGTNAYVCTAEVITFHDPVYFFDLSDLANITWTDTGTIDGYSTSLIDLGDGYLMGVGYGERSQLKIEVYKEFQGKVISVGRYHDWSYFQPNYKSYFVDREHDMIGLSIAHWNGPHYYLLVRFDGRELVEVARIRTEWGDMNAYRAFLEDGWLYLLTPSSHQMYVEQLFR